MPKHIIFFREPDYINGLMETTFIPHEGNTPDEVLAGCKRLFPFGSHFRVCELVDVTPKPKYRYVVDIERDSSYDAHRKVKEALVYEAESATDAANMARSDVAFSPTWTVTDVSTITSMKHILEGTDALG
jgi:hypothetical protein